MSRECSMHAVNIPKAKRMLGKPWCRWEDNIKMDLKEMNMNWI